MVDLHGVRRTAIAALWVSAVSRGILTFCRSRGMLMVGLIALAPFGEAVLSTGIYTVALKKLTTPETRGLAFGIQYGIFNLAGGLADLVADALRRYEGLTLTLALTRTLTTSVTTCGCKPHAHAHVTWTCNAHAHAHAHGMFM